MRTGFRIHLPVDAERKNRAIATTIAIAWSISANTALADNDRQIKLEQEMRVLAYYYSGLTPTKKWITSLILLPFSLYYLLTRGQFTLIDNADLVIHEAGHFFFMFFGAIIHAAGGTLMQVIFPLFLALYFWQQGYRTGVQIMIAWLGQNWINISVYAADAQARQLRLIGNGKHDWYYLLGELGIREYCQEIGWLFMGCSLITFLAALSIPLFYES